MVGKIVLLQIVCSALNAYILEKHAKSIEHAVRGHKKI